jgi:hypothetical protein
VGYCSLLVALVLTRPLVFALHVKSCSSREKLFHDQKDNGFGGQPIERCALSLGVTWAKTFVATDKRAVTALVFSKVALSVLLDASKPFVVVSCHTTQSSF